MSTTKSLFRFNSFYKQILIFVVLVFIARLVSMWGVPLGDSTEARYGEIARLMVSSNDWVRLMHYPGQFFWAKPPLSTWLSALSMKAFGVSALTARLPAWLLSILCLMLTARMAFNQFYYKGAIWVVGILATMIYFQVDAGTVMTDPSLMTCVTIVMLGFWLRIQGEHWLWGYVTFVGWGLGLLAKGLVMGVFSVLPLFVWLSINKQWKKCWNYFPWIKGGLLSLAIAAPWYILAEKSMPGFLNYFIVGEHFMRFLKPGWTGDMFGHAHHAPIGMIWIYFLGGAAPWSFLTIILRLKKEISLKYKNNDKAWFTYLYCFTLVPLIFFTFARNIIYPYVFPTLPAFALIVTSYIVIMLRRTKNLKDLKLFFYITSFLLVLASLLCTGLTIYYPEGFSKSTDQMIKIWQARQRETNEDLIYLHDTPEYSSMFYSQAQVKATRDKAQLCAWLKEGPKFLVLDSVQPTSYDKTIQSNFVLVASIRHRERIDSLYRVDKIPEFCN